MSGSCSAGAASPSFLTALRGISHRGDYDEFLDRPRNDPATLAGNLRDLRLMNRGLGWARTVTAQTRSLLPARRDVSLLDIATGSADVPRACARSLAREGYRVRAVGTDASAQVLAEARRNATHRSRSPRSQPATPPIALLRHDATLLPFADQSFDMVTLCLAAHHFDPPDLLDVLREMWRVCRCGIVVSDLERSVPSYLGARLMALVLRNPLTAHDGPVSVLRAYTRYELRALSSRAGLERVRFHRAPFRMTMTASKLPRGRASLPAGRRRRGGAAGGVDVVRQ